MGYLKISWTSRAYRHWSRILNERYENSGLDAAKRLVDKIDAAVERLGDFPRSGKTISKSQNEMIQRILIEKIVILFELKGNEIRILSLIDGRGKDPLGSIG